MKCHSCGKENAVINIRQIIGSDVKDIAFCRECAEKKGLIGAGDKIEFSIDQILEGLLVSNDKKKKHKADKCPSCGMISKEAGKEGRIGCGECLNTFPDEIYSFLEKNEIEAHHKGKLPKTLQTLKTLIIDREKLKSELEKSIQKEDYESAAKIRDQLYELDVMTGAGYE
ncbi:MAG: UvrB/UvrC motif-containing protein [Spirochaetales bacterium]|nr:UvrB/UvrC motif-containing protein [Spirochaetales bacterium]